MLQRAIITAASVIALTATANAADLGSYKGGPASYASVNWSGLYGGVNAGYGQGTSKLSIEDKGTYSDYVPGIGSVTGTGTDAQSKTFDSTGGFGGGQIGYNVQSGRAVFGVEGDLQASGISGETSVAAHFDPYYPADATSSAKAKSQLNYFGTLRGRLGYTFGNALVYATGGLAFGDATDTLSRTDLLGTTTSKSKSGTLTGYVLGAGTEYAINPAWSVKAEYQYIDLGSTNLSLGTSPVDAKLTDGHTYNTVRVGLNYHVGAGFDPLK
jgi:outer membrane immunogenic protein